MACRDEIDVQLCRHVSDIACQSGAYLFAAGWRRLLDSKKTNGGVVEVLQSSRIYLTP